MTAIQPPFLPCYFSLRSKYALPDGLAETHHLSWEDALWDIVDIYKIKKGSVILIPTFWCMDVVKNIEAHGLKYEYYPMDGNFQTSDEELMRTIQTYHPAIIIIFHAVGIRNTLMTADNNWMTKLSKQQIVIEDRVHSLIDPSELTIERDRHFVIDSWRKVVPLQGSAIYGKKSEISKFRHTHKSFSPYSRRVIWLWVKMQWWLILSSLKALNRSPKWDPLSKKLISSFAIQAEKAMLEAYDLIGDSTTAGSTLWLFIFLRRHINTPYIKDIKRKQVAQYEGMLQPLWQDHRFIRIPISPSDFGELRGYPVGIVPGAAHNLINALRERGVYIRSELEGSTWTHDKKVIYLPLGPHIRNYDISYICEILHCMTLTQGELLACQEGREGSLA